MLRSRIPGVVRARPGAIEGPASEREANGHLEQAEPSPVFEARIFRRLLTLASIYQQGDAAIILPCRFADVAALAGVSARTLDRVLSEEVDRGTLLMSDDAITILDSASLAARSEGGEGRA